MEENLILEGLLSMVTELKEKQEQQVTPASRKEMMLSSSVFWNYRESLLLLKT